MIHNQVTTKTRPEGYSHLAGYKPETIAAVIGNHLRWAAALRMPPLENGRRDPWSERRD